MTNNKENPKVLDIRTLTAKVNSMLVKIEAINSQMEQLRQAVYCDGTGRTVYFHTTKTLGSAWAGMGRHSAATARTGGTDERTHAGTVASRSSIC